MSRSGDCFNREAEGVIYYSSAWSSVFYQKMVLASEQNKMVFIVIVLFYDFLSTVLYLKLLKRKSKILDSEKGFFEVPKRMKVRQPFIICIIYPYIMHVFRLGSLQLL